VPGGVSTAVRTSSAIDDVCEQRLLKALDVLAKSEALVALKDQEIASRIELDHLKDQWLAVKDQLIAAQADLIKFYQSQKAKGKWKTLFERIEKVLILAAGIYVGRGL
jgi:hypothetical protein